MAEINVLVVVDTAHITTSNVSSKVVLVDDNGDQDTTSGDSSTFKIRASSGDNVQFRIVAINMTDTMAFVSFDKESGDTVFSSLPSSSNGWNGTVSGSTGDDEFFGITFTVNGTQYTLDPEINIKT